MKKNILISAILLAIIITTACLKSVWIGFIYFSLAFVIVLSGFWLIRLILYYYEDYFLAFDEDFKEYRAEVINSTALTSETFEQDIESHIKKFKKSQRKYKLIDIAKILFALMMIVICIVAIVQGKFNI